MSETVSLVVGGRYVSRKRPGVKVQLDGAEGEGKAGLVLLHFLKTGTRWRTPLWLFDRTYRRDTSGPLEREAVLS